MLKTDIVDRKSENSTKMKFELRKVCCVAKCYHTRIMWTWRKFREHYTSICQEELNTPNTIACQSLCHLVCHLLGILQVLLRNLIWLPRLTIVTTLLNMPDRRTENRWSILLGNGEKCKL